METSKNLPYIAVFQDIRKAMGISIYEYMVVAAIYELQNNPNSKHKGWYYGNRRYLAEYLDISERNLYSCLDRMEIMGLVRRDKETKFIQATGLWYDIVIMQDLKLARTLCRDTARIAVGDCADCSRDTARIADDNTIDNTTDNINSCASFEAPTGGELFVTQRGELGETPSPTDKKAQAEATEAETVNVETLPAAPKEDYIGELCDIYAEIHMRFKGIKYIPRGKDRKAMGQILSYYKRVEKDGIKVNAGKDKEQTKLDMRAFFEACHRIQDPWLSQNMELPLINSQFYKILGILKNGANKQVFGYNKRAEQQTAKEFQDLYGDQWQEEMSYVASRGFKIHL